MTALATPRSLPATGRRHIDLAHHHPEVVRSGDGGWTWTCHCGGAARRHPTQPISWRRALIEALVHSTQLAA